MSKTDDREREDAPSKKLNELYGLIEGIEIAMFTTRRPDGRLVSVPWRPRLRPRGPTSGS
jgi:hypothetical protein